MATEDWYADGYLLTDGSVRNVEYRKGLGYSPGKTGSNIRTPGWDGIQYVPKSFEQGSFVLNMWLTGDSQSAVYAAYERLLLAVSKKHRLVRYERVTADGVRRECYGEVVQAIEPDWLAQNSMRLSIEVAVPGAFWQDSLECNTGALPLSGLQSNSYMNLSAFAGASAPMGDLVYTVTGPISNIFLIDVASGEWNAWTGSIPGATHLTVDCAAGVITSPGGAPLDQFFYSGWRFLDLMPDDAGAAPALVMQWDTVGAGASLRVQGRRKYIA
jgi:hypothetical protein